MIAYNAALDAQTLRSGPSVAGYQILLREGEGALADNWMWHDRACWGAMKTVDFLVEQRVYGEPDPIFGAIAAPIVRDPALETLIKRAEAAREGASYQMKVVAALVEAVARRIIDRTPGADIADTGVA